MKVVSLAQDDRLIDVFSLINGDNWPEFLREGSDPVPYCWPTIFTEFPDCQLVLIDDDAAPAAVAHSLPVVWDGSTEGLPGGWDDAIRNSLSGLDSQIPFNTLAALSITVSGKYQGKGLSNSCYNP